jgi:putative addiction module CopG family antidote
MKVELTASLEKMVREKVDAGLYRDPAEVIADALQQMRDRDERERLKAARLLQAIDEGLKDIAEGRYETFNSREELETFLKAL